MSSAQQARNPRRHKHVLDLRAEATINVEVTTALTGLRTCRTRLGCIFPDSCHDNSETTENRYIAFLELFMPKFRMVCPAVDVSPGESKMFNVGGQMVGLFNIDGEFLAVSNECPHAGASLAHGKIDRDVVSCRIHHWRFCLRSGQYLDEDKPEFNARTFLTRVLNGDVQVSCDGAEE